MAKGTTRQIRTRPARKPREPLLTQIASFVDLFVWLLVLKSFFLPLFIIPTGSMAETLMGAHATYTCPNCGYEFPVGFHTAAGPTVVQCPNCRFQQPTRREMPGGVTLRKKAGDRIVVHGWPYDVGGRLAPQRWDVVVFKNPNQPDVNYIKRLIGLPGETIEIIDGDVFVKKPGEDELRPAVKTRWAQRALWMPYYNHDYRPRREAQDWIGRPLTAANGPRQPRWPPYLPRWVALAPRDGWQDLEQRVVRFDGVALSRRTIQFATQPGDDPPPGRILDIYGYNSDVVLDYHDVTDVRLSADVALLDGDGYVELVISKHDDYFFGRLAADGTLTLMHARGADGPRETWGTARIDDPAAGHRLALGHADYHVTLEVDGRVVLESDPARYRVTAEQARSYARLAQPPTIRIAAGQVVATLAHLLIERDVYYTSGNLRDRLRTPGGLPGNGTQGNPITLRPDAYFVCGDNSPASHDSRAWSAADLGPHLRRDFEQGRYDVGTVPADQMIGRAFFVYWPGFLPLSERGPTLLPDMGRIRWIH